MRHLNLLDDLRRNDLARTAPGSEAVEDHQAGLVAESLVEGRLAVMPLAATLKVRAETMTSPARARQRNGAIVAMKKRTSGGCGHRCQTFWLCWRRTFV